MKYPEYPHFRRIFPTGVIAGLAGGLAEVVWIAVYSHLSGSEGAIVARGITQSLSPWAGSSSLAIPLGIAIHMSLAVLLGLAIALLLRTLFPRVSGTALEPIVVVALLVGVWAANFFLVLPVLNPDFVALVPYPVSLISKVLFGFCAALVMQLVPDQPHTKTCC